MQTLNTILNIVLIVLSIAMIAVVLMQQSKSAGLGSAFGGDTQSFTARGPEGPAGRPSFSASPRYLQLQSA